MAISILGRVTVAEEAQAPDAVVELHNATNDVVTY